MENKSAKIWAIYLNPMRGKMEEKHCICVSTDRKELEDLLEKYQVAPYTDAETSFGGREILWNKWYKKGSVFEWYNPPLHCGEGYGIIDLGTREEFIQKHAATWDNFIMEYSIDRLIPFKGLSM